MQVKKNSKALIFTEDDKFLVTVDALIGDLVANTTAVQSVISPGNGWRSEVLDGSNVLAIIDATSDEQVGKDIDRATALTQDPRIILVIRGEVSIQPHLDRVHAVLPQEKLEEMLHCAAKVVDAGLRVVPDSAIQSPEGQSSRREEQLKDDPDYDRLSHLSPTETKVLCGLMDGLSNKHIARQIEISDNTVRVHIRNIFLKLGVANRTQAALLGTRYSFTGILQDRIGALNNRARALSNVSQYY